MAMMAAGSALRFMRMSHNQLYGSFPHAMPSMTRLFLFMAAYNSLRGQVPTSLGSMTRLASLDLCENKLSGPIPEAIASMTETSLFILFDNLLSGTIPHAVGSMARKLTKLSVGGNRLSGSIPAVISSMTELVTINVSRNHLRGSIPDAPSHMRNMKRLEATHNVLSGSLGVPIWSLTSLATLRLQHNRLSGTMLCNLREMMGLENIDLVHNELVGPIPSSFPSQLEVLLIDMNQFTGSLHAESLVTLEKLAMLGCSGNMLEGTIPQVPALILFYLAMQGQTGQSSNLKGPLPPTLNRASELQLLFAHHQELEGAIPPLSGTMAVLSLYSNRFQIFPGMQMGSGTSMVLLHNNLLSCHLPMCSNLRASMSLVALGNHLMHPAKGFPSWLSPMERDGLFWISETEGRNFLLKLAGAGAFWIAILLGKIGSPKLLSVLEKWHAGLMLGRREVAVATSRVLSSVAKAALISMLFLAAVLFSWKLYKCPRTFALASACLRDSLSTRILVVLMWASLCFYSASIGQMTKPGTVSLRALSTTSRIRAIARLSGKKASAKC